MNQFFDSYFCSCRELVLTASVCAWLLGGTGCIGPNTDELSFKNEQFVSVDTLNLFEILSPVKTGISFVNNIVESPKMNGLTYEYLYNGGGVAVCDLNQDDLPDIYFISNLDQNKFFLNKGKLKFEDVTEAAGLTGGYGFRTGVTTVDINEDGLMDIYVCKSGAFTNENTRRNELYINQGNNENGIPYFKEQAEKFGLDLPHYSTQAAFLDFDRDGDLDLFLINHGTDPGNVVNNEAFLLKKKNNLTTDRLFQNDGMRFTDVSSRAGIINNAMSFGLGLAVGDINNDQWPDVIVGHDYYEKDHVYINNQNGTFSEVSLDATRHMSNFSMGNDIADFNNDGWLDFISVDMVSDNNYDVKTSMSGMNPTRFYDVVGLGLHHQYMYNALQVNNGAVGREIPAFSDVAQFAGISSTDWSWAPLLFDMDNDGLKDLFVSNGVKRDFRNNDFVNFKNKEVKKYLKKINKENGDLSDLTDEYMGKLLTFMPKRKKINRFYRNQGNHTFRNTTNEWSFGFASASNGAAYADLDMDGDLDIVTNNTDDLAFVYENKAWDYKLGNYLKVKLKGEKSNKDGIGSRVIVQYGGEVQVQELYLTRGFQSSIDKILHFGVGSANTIDTLKVIWPDGKQQILNLVQANQMISLDYYVATDASIPEKIDSLLFEDITPDTGLKHLHHENDFNDFQRELLLPHRMSRFGPALAVGDVNNDRLDDVYVGGAVGQPGYLYTQGENGRFTEKQIFEATKSIEEVEALFFDADNDGDQDLLVISGGNEHLLNSKNQKCFFFFNDGMGNYSLGENVLPDIRISGGDVQTLDIENDGDLDLLITGRQLPGRYGFAASTTLLENQLEGGRLTYRDISQEVAPEFQKIGMITSAACKDFNNDGRVDIALCGEWTVPMVFFNENGKFKKQNSKLDSLSGWWFSMTSEDFDKDGDQDIMLGNLGLNYKYKASKKAPFQLHTRDFDDNGSLDIVLSFNENGKQFPLRGRECTSNQMPFVKEKFKTYHAFGSAGLEEVFGAQILSEALALSANTFASIYLENDGLGNFKSYELPSEAQFSSINSIVPNDFDGDGHLDALVSGNLYNSEVETPRNDASYGLFLKGDGKGNFKAIPAYESGLYVRGEVRHASIVKLKKGKGVAFARNDDYLKLIQVR